MSMDEQKSRVMAFRAMHRGPRILVLPNAWDVASARVFEEAGYGAIATTSAGVAFSLGYPDGQRISREEMLARVGRIARAVKVPVTADVEAGYGPKPEDAAQTAREVIEAGAVGMNLQRLVAYRDAGADCVFLPGLIDAETIGRVVKDLQCPVNILTGPGAPSIPELERLGVARVTVGSAAMRATLGLVKRIAEELKSSGTYANLEGGMAYADLNKMLG